MGWLRASAEKVISLDWWRGVELRTYLDEQAGEALPFMVPVSEWVFAPLAVPIAAAMVLVQFMIGICFATAHNLRAALYAALTLNFTFLAMGSVTPSAFYLVMQLSLLVALRSTRQSPREQQLHHSPHSSHSPHSPHGRRVRQPARSSRWASTARIAVGLAVAAAMAPFISTLRPAEVIHDPALMLITVAVLAVCCEAARLPSASAASRATEVHDVTT